VQNFTLFHKLAFHDTDTDTDTDIVADILARIVASMFVSVSVSASWNASYRPCTCLPRYTSESHDITIRHGCGVQVYYRQDRLTDLACHGPISLQYST